MQELSNYTKSNLNLYHEKKDCCGCGVCENVCPKDAIEMKLDSFGAYYPSINLEKCIGCNICINSCAYRKGDEMGDPLHAYAAVNKKENQLALSSSGGVFSAIASYFLENGNCVCGAMMDLDNRRDIIHHCIITKPQNLKLLQGSKYGQSRLFDLYDACRKIFESGKKILFSGTPCQVNAFKHIFKKYESQLFTLDLICHGVPGNKVFDDYINYIELNTGFKIVSFVFRDKNYGWGCNGQYSTIKVNAGNVERDMKLECKEISSSSSSYYRYFLLGNIYRDCCYDCPFATSKRTGDLTIGDYWGIEKYNPELLAENDGVFIRNKGISCVLANTKKGLDLIQHLESYCDFKEVDKNNVIEGNSQLRHPVALTKKRKKLKKKYEKNGYRGIEKEYEHDLRKNRLKNIISGMIPKHIKLFIKRRMNR